MNHKARNAVPELGQEKERSWTRDRRQGRAIRDRQKSEIER